MILVRQVFQAKYGRGDELVGLFKEFHGMADIPNRPEFQSDLFKAGLQVRREVLGADYVQRGALAPWTMSVALSYSLLIGNILLINGVPDAQADARVGKRTLAVRLGAARVAVVYGAWAGVSVAVSPKQIQTRKTKRGGMRTARSAL